jgi:hypothetical protein
LQQTHASETTIGIAHLFLSASGLILFVLGGYMSLASSAQAAFVYPGQYFLAGGVLLCFIGIISILRRNDF